MKSERKSIYLDKLSEFIKNKWKVTLANNFVKESKVSYFDELKNNEKQKIKFTYGMLEKQFRNYFKKASQMKGETGLNLLVMLESRLDNVVYKLGFAPTRPSARQLVSHGHFLVNNRKVNIASYRLKPGDLITVRDKSKKLDLILNSIKMVKGDLNISWLSVDKAKMEGTFISLPERDEIDLTMNEQLVVEYYSR